MIVVTDQPRDVDAAVAVDRDAFLRPLLTAAEDEQAVGEVDEDRRRDRGDDPEQDGVVEDLARGGVWWPCPAAASGAITATTIGVAIALSTSEAITIRRRWFGSFTLGRSHVTWRNPSM